VAAQGRTTTSYAVVFTVGQLDSPISHGLLEV
jgi:hypothetical protein